MKIKEYSIRDRNSDPYRTKPSLRSQGEEQITIRIYVQSMLDTTRANRGFAGWFVDNPPFASGSLFSHPEKGAVFDPYLKVTPQASYRRSNSNSVFGDFDLFCTALASSFAPDRKTLASFVGRVESLHEDSASVSLLDQKTRERFEADCDAEVLRQNGISEGDEFTCEVIREGPATTVEFKRLPPKPVTIELLQQIEAEVKARWD